MTISKSELADAHLAALIAVDKKLRPAVTDAKNDAKGELAHLNDLYGVDRREIKVGTQTVGKVSLSQRKPKIVIKPGREAIALDALQKMGLTKTVPIEDWAEQFTCVNGDVVDSKTGEVAEWATIQPGAQYARVTGCNFDDVNNALKALGTSAAAAALTEGNTKDE